MLVVYTVVFSSVYFDQFGYWEYSNVYWASDTEIPLTSTYDTYEQMFSRR